MHSAHRRSGRISLVLLAGLCAAAFVSLLFAFSGQTPRAAAGEFMSALATANIDKLTELSVIHDKGPADIRKEWQATLQHGRTFLFAWDITAVQSSGDSATARLDLTKDPRNPTSYGEHFELRLVKTNGTWKVSVPEISREMFPYLPR